MEEDLVSPGPPICPLGIPDRLHLSAPFRGLRAQLAGRRIVLGVDRLRDRLRDL
jgi:hypothetical protein